jgi:hypothetical protein
MILEGKVAMVVVAPVVGLLIAALSIAETNGLLDAASLHDKPVTYLLASAVVALSGLVGWLVKKGFDVVNAFLADRIEDRKVSVSVKDAIEALRASMDRRPCALVESGAVRVVMRTHKGETAENMRAADEDTPIPKQKP